MEFWTLTHAVGTRSRPRRGVVEASPHRLHLPQKASPLLGAAAGQPMGEAAESQPPGFMNRPLVYLMYPLAVSLVNRLTQRE